MLPEVFECPRCERQFVIEVIAEDRQRVHCPQCGRYLGERDLAYVLRSELDDLAERLEFEQGRLESDAAIYGMGGCEGEMGYYGREIHSAITVLRDAIARLKSLSASYSSGPLPTRSR